MPHKIKKEMLRDLITQEKMNLKFIQQLPKIDYEAFRYTVKTPVSGEFSVLGSGFVPSEKGFKAIKPLLN
jgi:hypothetical protein